MLSLLMPSPTTGILTPRDFYDWILANNFIRCDELRGDRRRECEAGRREKHAGQARECDAFRGRRDAPGLVD
jgi:hypothetical protein